uniref:Immunoglobulin V-set domain-containing protein n=1 Tax=Salarias fasciatus TaxID=181472 RepID=A0A672JSD0_SALFA
MVETGINNITCSKLPAIFISCFTVQSSVPPVFVQKGKDVLLEVDNVTENFFVFVWKFDEESSSLVTFGRDGTSEISPAYTGRIDIPDNKKYSVILKNLQETDSGVYTGRLTTFKGDFPLVQHNIIVQDVVSPVQLEVNSVSSSSHSCNVTLTCSTADSHISSTFRCIDQKCDQDGGNQSKITNSSSTLEVYLWNVTVICKHRNQVSSTEDRTDIQHVCPQLTGRSERDSTKCKHTGWILKILNFKGTTHYKHSQWENTDNHIDRPPSWTAWCYVGYQLKKHQVLLNLDWKLCRSGGSGFVTVQLLVHVCRRNIKLERFQKALTWKPLLKKVAFSLDLSSMVT